MLVAELFGHWQNVLPDGRTLGRTPFPLVNLTEEGGDRLVLTSCSFARGFFDANALERCYMVNVKR